jgi:GTP-binding protein Era
MTDLPPPSDDLDSVFEDAPEDHRSGVVAVVGRPNVGKSTLINRILGQKIAAVSPKPQTTRKRQLGILSDEKTQVIFVDTPGLHLPRTQLGEVMVKIAENAFRDADVIVVLQDVSVMPDRADQHMAETVGRLRGKTPLLLVLNKADLLSKAKRLELIAAHSALIAYDKAMLVSALNGDGVDELVKELIARMPLGPRYFPVDQVSEANMRFIAAEIIREKVLLHTEQEIPHSVAVEIEGYREQEDGKSEIDAVLYVERDTQKGILIGKGGEMIKKIGTDARKELKRIIGAPVHLEMHVKVLKNWRSDPKLLQRLGYTPPPSEDEG